MATFASTMSTFNHDSTMQMMSGLWVSARAKSLSSLGRILLALKYKIFKGEEKWGVKELGVELGESQGPPCDSEGVNFHE